MKNKLYQLNPTSKFFNLRNAPLRCQYVDAFVLFSLSRLLRPFSPFKYWDPEMGSGSGLSYPTQRVFNVGVQFSINK